MCGMTFNELFQKAPSLRECAVEGARASMRLFLSCAFGVFATVVSAQGGKAEHLIITVRDPLGIPVQDALVEVTLNIAGPEDVKFPKIEGLTDSIGKMTLPSNVKASQVLSADVIKDGFFIHQYSGWSTEVVLVSNISAEMCKAFTDSSDEIKEQDTALLLAVAALEPNKTCCLFTLFHDRQSILKAARRRAYQPLAPLREASIINVLTPNYHFDAGDRLSSIDSEESFFWAPLVPRYEAALSRRWRNELSLESEQRAELGRSLLKKWKALAGLSGNLVDPAPEETLSYACEEFMSVLKRDGYVVRESKRVYDKPKRGLLLSVWCHHPNVNYHFWAAFERVGTQAFLRGVWCDRTAILD
jgi:hypothetical protein